MTATPQQPQHMISADDILAGLDPDQRAVATELDGPMRVLAGAGTGKTRGGRTYVRPPLQLVENPLPREASQSSVARRRRNSI